MSAYALALSGELGASAPNFMSQMSVIFPCSSIQAASIHREPETLFKSPPNQNGIRVICPPGGFPLSTVLFGLFGSQNPNSESRPAVPGFPYSVVGYHSSTVFLKHAEYLRTPTAEATASIVGPALLEPRNLTQHSQPTSHSFACFESRGHFV